MQTITAASIKAIREKHTTDEIVEMFGLEGRGELLYRRRPNSSSAFGELCHALRRRIEETGSTQISELEKTPEQIYAEEVQESHARDYKEILLASGTWQEAYNNFQKKANECLAKADEWRNKVYKKHGGHVLVGAKYNDYDAKMVSVDAINERRRERNISGYEKDACEYRKYADFLKEKCAGEIVLKASIWDWRK